MKKIILIFIFSTIFYTFAIHKSGALAQTENQFFDTSKIVRQEKITANPSSNLAITIFPFTTIQFPAGSFESDVTIYIYKDNFDNIKTALPKGQSPISSYYFTFKNSEDEAILPLKPLKVQSYNNFINTNTYFYPLKSPKEIDTSNQKQWQGHIKVLVDLPLNDTGFIVAASTNIESNNAAIKPTVIPNSNTNSNNVQNQTTNTSIKLYYWIIFLLVALVVIIVITLVFIRIRRKIKK